MANEERLFDSTLLSLLIAFCICILVLLILTWNVLATIVVITCVSIVNVTIGFIIVQLDWQLGVAECICIITAFGLSIDYSVLLATDYLKSPQV